MIKILVLYDSSAVFSRRFLMGLVRYSNEHGPWSFYRLPAYFKSMYGENGILDLIKKWEIDAVISQWEYEKTDFLAKINIPVFLQSYKDETGFFSKISGDYVKIGVMAAQFFTKRRFMNFAFYGHINFYWSKGREIGYQKEVEKNGGNYFHFESDLLSDGQWTQSHIDLDKWLRSLPKPVALFACDDNFALQVSEMCKLNNINIPQEISLLGVDNDELICNLSHPTISSIITDDENAGYTTGMMFHRQIINKKNAPFNIVVEPIRIELRNSTEKYDIADAYILNIVNYIEENVTSDLSIEDLTKIVPLSRRSLEMKFRKTMGTSIYKYVLDAKMEYIVNLLTTTNISVNDIAIDVGFNDVRNIYRIFKNHTGYTPIEFRKKFQIFPKQ